MFGLLKQLFKDNSNKKILIAVPRPLVAQWRTELLIKFEIIPGQNINNNYVYNLSRSDYLSVINMTEEQWQKATLVAFCVLTKSGGYFSCFLTGLKLCASKEAFLSKKLA